ncbi:hypothetical protein KSF78_0008510 [Schistosoma japonicum]|nr:hypothetical protein KSF78_0008510 [Schistosoma japonicum]
MIVFESNIGKTLNHINGSLNLIANLIKNSENQMLRQIGSLNLIANLIKSSENQLQRQIDHSKLGTLKTCLNTEYERINKTESENSVKRCNSLVSVRSIGNVHLILTIFNIHTSPALLIGLRKQSTLFLTSNVFYTMILIKNI